MRHYILYYCTTTQPKMIATPEPPNKTPPQNLLTWLKPPSSQPQQPYPQLLRILQSGQSLFMSEQTRILLSTHQIYSKLIGLSSSSKNISEFASEPYLLDKYSTTYVVTNQILQYCIHGSNQKGVDLMKSLVREPAYLAYVWLMGEKKVFLLDGHKFGCEFLAYESDPDIVHARFLVFIRQNQKQLSPIHVSRLAGISKKKALVITLVQDSTTNMVQIECQQVQPRVQENKKIKAQSSSITEQLQQLKRLAGFDV